MSYGTVATIVQEVEQRRTAFAVARLIMMTGIDLRAYELNTVDDEQVLARIWKALPSVLSPADLAALRAKLR
ncbi:MAG: hypothetical protein QM784_40675 [Polyangiaceae bacterium]|jgi:uncharacterized protein with NRDE domain